MRKIYFANALILMVSIAFFGCATMNSLTPKNIRQTQLAIDKARVSGADQRCPQEYQEIVTMWEEALGLYRTCDCKREAVAKMQAIREKAGMLCQDSDADGVPDSKDKCPDTPSGVKVDETGCPVDSDGDGIPDFLDKCPNTPSGLPVDRTGCEIDSDADGVPDSKDKCPNTPRGFSVDETGCPIDSDGDGVPDTIDKCPNTPSGLLVDRTGCPIDSDGDGVPDTIDKCPDTPSAVKVDNRGCPLDTDGDGVFDYLDQCPGTPKGVQVNEVGCWVCKDVRFDFDKWDIKPEYYSNLDEAVDCMKQNPLIKVEIQGHTDNTGTVQYNQILSQRRARAAMEYFLKKGIAKERLSVIGYGLSRPIASNNTKQGRAKNRRVQLRPIY